MKRHFAVAVALVLLVGCSGFAAAQDNKDAGDDATPSPSSTSGAILPPVKPNVAITNGSNETRGPVKAIDCASNANGTITVTGTGRASGAPDVARIRMSVEAREPNAADARAKAAETTQAVLDALSQFPRAEARSNSISVYAQRDTQGGVTRTTGFEFRQSLSVTLTSPGSDNAKKDGNKSGSSNETTTSDTLASLASKALDAAIAAGGDRLSVDNLEFELAPERAAEAVKLARSRALVDLREKAERDAGSLGLTLGALQTVKVDPYPRTGEPRSMRSSAAATAADSSAAKAGPATPLSSPNSETEVIVEGVYRVCSPS